MGSISAQPLAGQTVDVFITGGFGNFLALVGDTTSLGSLTLTVDGSGWTVAAGSFNGSTTEYVITPSGGGFSNGVAYTVDLSGGAPDTTPPTITSSASPSNVENVVLAHALTANESVTWAIRSVAQDSASVDAARFEISGSTLRWASNGTKDYEAPDDADTNNTYIVVVRATDTSGNTTDQTITVTVTNGFDGPTWVGKSTAAGSTAATSIDFTSSGRAAGDKLYIAIETANQAATAPSGFTLVDLAGKNPQGRGTAAAAGGVRLTLFEKISDGTETTVSIADSGDHQYAVGVVVRPASGQTIAIEASDGKNAAASTSHLGNALTTGADDCLILEFWATDRDSAGPSYSGEANATPLGNLTERHDNGTTAGAGGGIVLYSGERQAAGSVSATTATSAASVAWCAITLALKNVPAALPFYRGPSAWATFYKGVKADGAVYKGPGTLHA